MKKEQLLALRHALLQECLEDQALWINNGPIVRTFPELVRAAESMDDRTFRYHVNEDNNKNDFADWLRNVFGDREFAMQLEGVMDRKVYLKILKDRLTTFENLKP